MSWLAARRIEELQAELALLREQLAAEKAVTAGYDKCLDDAMEAMLDSRNTIDRQHAVIETLTERLSSYQQLFDDKVKPLCRETLALCGARGDPQGFIE